MPRVQSKDALLSELLSDIDEELERFQDAWEHLRQACEEPASLVDAVQDRLVTARQVKYQLAKLRALLQMTP